MGLALIKAGSSLQVRVLAYTNAAGSPLMRPPATGAEDSQDGEISIPPSGGMIERNRLRGSVN